MRNILIQGLTGRHPSVIIQRIGECIPGDFRADYVHDGLRQKEDEFAKAEKTDVLTTFVKDTRNGVVIAARNLDILLYSVAPT